MTTVLDRTATGTAVARPPSLRQALALGRVELQKLVLHPLTGVGIGLSGFAWWQVFDRGSDLRQTSIETGLAAFPLAGMVLLAANLIASRGRRDGSEDTFRSLPASPHVRTIAISIASVGPAVIALLLTVTAVLRGQTVGVVGTPSLAELLVGPVLVVCAVQVGILFERIAPRSLFAPVVVVALGFIEGAMNRGKVGQFWHRLAPWNATMDGPPEIWVRATGWHLPYLVGIAGLLATAAVLRHQRSRAVAVTGAVALALAVVAGTLQVAEPSDVAARRIAELVVHPESYQMCVSRTATYCVFPGHRYALGTLIAATEGVLRELPPSVGARRLVVRQRIAADVLVILDPKVLARVERMISVRPLDRFIWPDDGQVHPDPRVCEPTQEAFCEAGVASHVAEWALGMPAVPVVRTDSGHPVVGPRQPSDSAREVVALWLAGVATPRTRAALASQGAMASKDDGSGSRIGECTGAGAPAVAYSPADLGIARLLLAIPPDVVGATIRAHWTELVEPATPATRVLSLFGLPQPSGELLGPPATACA